MKKQRWEIAINRKPQNIILVKYWRRLTLTASVEIMDINIVYVVVLDHIKANTEPNNKECLFPVQHNFSPKPRKPAVDRSGDSDSVRPRSVWRGEGSDPRFISLSSICLDRPLGPWVSVLGAEDCPSASRSLNPKTTAFVLWFFIFFLVLHLRRLESTTSHLINKI